MVAPVVRRVIGDDPLLRSVGTRSVPRQPADSKRHPHIDTLVVGRVAQRELDEAPRLEIGGEVAAADDHRRPPQLSGGSLVRARRLRTKQEALAAPGEQPAMLHLRARNRANRGAGDPCNVRGDGISLPAGQGALLDRMVGSVAGGVDSADSDNPPELVDREEATRVTRQAQKAWAAEGWQRDDAPDDQARAVSDTDVTVPGDLCADAAMHHEAQLARVLGAFLRDVLRANASDANFRLFGPDETASNRLSSVFEATDRAWEEEILVTDEHLAPDGR